MAAMQPYSRILDESNQAGVGFLVVEVNAGLTFLNLATTTTDRYAAGRNRDLAHLAYENIFRYAHCAVFEAEDKLAFTEKLLRLKSGLLKAGYAI